MNKILLFFLILVIISGFSLVVKPRTDSGIEDLFGDDEEIEAIVLLKGHYNASQDFIYNNNYNDIVHYFDLTNNYTTINGFAGKLKRNNYQRLIDNPKVGKIVKSEIKSIFLNESVPQVNTTDAWRTVIGGINITGKGETVCVIDTGIDYTHTSLGECTKDTFLAGNCGKVLAGHDFVNNDNDPMDDHGHGTHVAGIIASTNETYRGVAPDATLVALKVCNFFGGCRDKDIIAGIDWCINNAPKYNISVISMSLGGGLFKRYCDNEPKLAPFKVAIDAAISRNISVVVATGNFASTNAISAPACIRNSTAVSSVTKSDFISSFSNRNSITDLFAPGTDIKSTVPKRGCVLCDPTGFSTLSGTSMATPHVSGAFVLLHQFKKLQENILLTPSQIQDSLNATGKKIDDTSGSGLLFPRINIYAALQLLNQTIFNIPPEGKGLKIIDADAKIDGRKISSIADNEKISREAKPQSIVELKIKVKNDFSERADVKIEKIKVKATIEEIDSGSDLEEESKEFNLRAQDEKTVTLKFNLPLNIDEGIFNVLVEAEGEDKDGNVYNEQFNIGLDVEKGKHDLSFLQFEVSPIVIICNRIVNIKYKIINSGQKDQKDATLEIKNFDLGLDSSVKNILIPSGIEGNTISKSSNFKIDESTKQGTYPIIANLYSDDGKLKATKKVELKVQDCVQAKDLREEGDEVVLFTSQEIPKRIETIQQPFQSTATKVFSEEISIKLFLVSTLIFSTFFIFVVVILFVKFKV